MSSAGFENFRKISHLHLREDITVKVLRPKVKRLNFFRVMTCTDEKKVSFKTHMLAEEAYYWWDNACQRLETTGTTISYENFKKLFLDKSFPKNVCNHKESEFLQLKPGNMIIADYVAKFEVLSRFCPRYNGFDVESSKCLKFETGLLPKIKQYISYKEIHRFSMLVNKCIIYDEKNRARSTCYKSVNPHKDNKFSNQIMVSRMQFKVDTKIILAIRSPCTPVSEKGNGNENGNSRGGTLTPQRCGKCGKMGHRDLNAKMKLRLTSTVESRVT